MPPPMRSLLDDPDLAGLLDEEEDPDLAGLLDAPGQRPNKVNELPTIDIEGDPRADEPWYASFLRTSGELGQAGPAGAGRDMPGEVRAAAEAEAGKQALPATTMLLPIGAGGNLAARLGGAAIQGGLAGGVNSVMNTQHTDPAEIAWEALSKAEDAGALGLGLGAAGEAIAPAVSAVGNGLGNAAQGLAHRANVNRVAASGAYGAQLRNLAQNRGSESIDELGQNIERLGMHKGKGPFGFLPQPSSTYLDNAANVLDDATARLTSAEAQISPQMPQVNITPAVQRLEGEAVTRGRAFAPEGKGEAVYANEFRGNLTDPNRTNAVLDEAGNPVSYHTDFGDALAEKRDLYTRINFARKGGRAESPYREQLQRDVAAALARGSEEALERSAAGGLIDPAVAQQWRQANTDYGAARQTHDFAFGRTFQEAGNQPVSLPGWLGAGATGAATGSVPGAMAGAIAGHLVKTRGRSALAGTERGLSSMMGGASKVTQGAGEALGGASGEAGAFEQHRQRIQAETRGDMLEPVITKAVNQQPELFGPYLPGFITASQSNDPHEIASLLDRLKSDERWRTEFLPRFQQMTAQPGGF